MDESNNLFLAIARILWARGEDGELIARECAKTLEWIIKDGKGPNCDLHAEFDKLRSAE
jgi:hypothetical protein